MQLRASFRVALVSCGVSAIALAGACVGGDPVSSGTNTSTDSGTSGDATSTGDGTAPGDGQATNDAGPCDLSKPFSVYETIEAVNGASAENAHTLTADETEIIFASTREDDTPGAGDNANLWGATRAGASEKFGTPTQVVTTALNAVALLDSDPTLSDDGKSIIYVQRMAAGQEHRFKLATRNAPATAFGAPSTVTFGGSNDPNPGGAYPKASFLVPNGALYFVMQTNPDGGTGPKYRVFRASPTAAADKFEAAVEQKYATPDIGIEADAVVVTADEKTMYVSTFTGGAADSSIAVLTRATTAHPWSAATPLDALNSGFHDQPRWISRDGCRLYFTSERSAAGDIYVARRQ